LDTVVSDDNAVSFDGSDFSLSGLDTVVSDDTEVSFDGSDFSMSGLIPYYRMILSFVV
jgi:hypothetical protein